jgi:hypothetical protein
MRSTRSKRKPKIEYFLKLTTWKGYCPVARHYYASMRWNDGDYQFETLEHNIIEECMFCKGKGCEYCDPEGSGTVPYKTSRFDSESEATRFGIDWFKKRKDKGILYLGDSAYMEPHHILAGVPEKTRKAANKLCAEAEARWRKAGVQDKKYLAMYEKWKKLVHGR